MSGGGGGASWRTDLHAEADRQQPGRLDAWERDIWDDERIDRLRHMVEEGYWGDRDAL